MSVEKPRVLRICYTIRMVQTDTMATRLRVASLATIDQLTVEVTQLMVRRPRMVTRLLLLLSPNNLAEPPVH